jgi:WD40 repeat protein
MSSSLLQGIVRIIAIDGRTLGTGFLIHPSGLIATCAHVLEAEKRYLHGNEPEPLPVRVVLHFFNEEREAKIEQKWFRSSKNQDIAILRLCPKKDDGRPAGLEPTTGFLTLGLTSPRLDRIDANDSPAFTTFGFPRSKPVNGLPGHLCVVGDTMDAGYKVFSVRSEEVSYGYSGAPIWDDDRQCVIGMNVSIVDAGTDRGGRLTKTAFFIPVETFLAICGPLLPTGKNPYRHLDVFETKDAALYFGRDELITSLLTKVEANPLSLVVGVSGSGKSSFVRAGLAKGLNKLASSDLPSRVRRIFQPGRNPLLNLIVALEGPDHADRARVVDAFKLPTQADANREDVLNALKSMPANDLISSLRRFADQSPLIIICDQFERLYTDCVGDGSEEDRLKFVDVLTRAAGTTLKVILAVRADYYGRTVEFPGPARAAQRAQVNIVPMTAEELRQAIEQPAMNLLRTFQPGLVEMMIAAVIERSGDLPLLQLALTLLWEKDSGTRILTSDSYKSFDGIRGVIVKQAETQYAASITADPNSEVLYRDIFIDLVIAPPVGPTIPSVRDISRRALQRDLAPRSLKLADALSKTFLITASIDPLTSEPTFEVSHEALIRNWPRLRDWVSDNRDFSFWFQSELLPGYGRWSRKGENEGDLERSPIILQRATHYQKKYPTKFAGNVGRYVKCSIRAARRRNIWRIFAFVSIPIVLLVATFLIMQLRTTKLNTKLISAQLDTANLNAKLTSVQLNTEKLNAQLTSARDLYEQGILALQNSEVLEAETDFTKSLALDDRRATRERLIETRARGATIGPSLNPPSGSGNKVIGIAPRAAFAAIRTSAGEIVFWDISRDRPVGNVRRPTVPKAAKAAFSADSSWCAWDEQLKPGEGDQPETLHLKRWSDGKEWTFPGDDKPISALVFSNDSQMLAFATERGQITLIELHPAEANSAISADPKQLDYKLNGPPYAIWGLAFSPDHVHLASCGSTLELRLWNWHDRVSPGTALKGHLDTVYSVTFSPDGSTLASGSTDSTIRFWNVKSPDVAFAVIAGDFGQPNKLSFSSGGRSITGACSDGTIRVWDSPSKRELFRFHTVVAGDYGAFAENDDVLVAGADDGRLFRWRLNAGQLVKEIPNASLNSPEQPASCVAIDPAIPSQWIAAGGQDGHLRFWSYPDFSMTSDVAVSSGRILCLAANPKRPQVAWAGDDAFVHVVDTRTQVEQKLLILENHNNPNFGKTDQVWGIRFSSDGSHLACGTYKARTVHIWDLDNPVIPPPLDSDNGAVWNVAFGTTNDDIAAACGDTNVRCWKLPSTQPTVYAGHTGEVWGLDFSPDQIHLASGGTENAIRIWTLGDPNLSRILLGHTGMINSLIYTLDGRWLASAGVDSTIRLWQCNNGDVVKDADKSVLVLRKSNGPLWWISASSDSNWLVTAGLSGRIAAWNLKELSRLLTAHPKILAAEANDHTGL